MKRRVTGDRILKQYFDEDIVTIRVAPLRSRASLWHGKVKYNKFQRVGVKKGLTHFI